MFLKVRLCLRGEGHGVQGHGAFRRARAVQVLVQVVSEAPLGTV